MTNNIFSTDPISFRRPYDPLLPPKPYTDEISLLNSPEKTHEAMSPFFSSQSSSSLKRLTSTEEPQAHKKQKTDPSNQSIWDNVDISVLNPITTLETTEPLFSDFPFTLPEDAFWTGRVPLEEPKQILHESNSLHAPLSYESNSSSSSPAASSGEAAAQIDSSVNPSTAKPSRRRSLKKATHEQLIEAAQEAIILNNTSNTITKYKKDKISISRSHFYRLVDNLKNPELKKATKEQVEKAAKEAIDTNNKPEIIKNYKNQGILITRSALDYAVKKQRAHKPKEATLEDVEDAAEKVISAEKKEHDVIKEYKEKNIVLRRKILRSKIQEILSERGRLVSENIENTKSPSTHTNWVIL